MIGRACAEPSLSNYTQAGTMYGATSVGIGICGRTPIDGPSAGFFALGASLIRQASGMPIEQLVQEYLVLTALLPNYAPIVAM